ncbi:hypothetical protein Scep_001398 [Stephania cephalantha]|uniref:Uncharacterized protein n=1 Tax=Stephania cephalantha TaxID=152367 RepID=A0AAP0Q3B3_9MAGN
MSYILHNIFKNASQSFYKFHGAARAHGEGFEAPISQADDGRLDGLVGCKWSEQGRAGIEITVPSPRKSQYDSTITHSRSIPSDVPPLDAPPPKRMHDN